jgi:uncharacterized membrane protein
MAKRDEKKWVQTVKTVTVDVPPGTMKKEPKEMARILIAKNRNLPRPKKSINQFIQFHINRAGKGMSEETRQKLRKAMEIVRQKAKTETSA